MSWWARSSRAFQAVKHIFGLIFGGLAESGSPTQRGNAAPSSGSACGTRKVHAALAAAGQAKLDWEVEHLRRPPHHRARQHATSSPGFYEASRDCMRTVPRAFRRHAARIPGEPTTSRPPSPTCWFRDVALYTVVLIQVAWAKPGVIHQAIAAACAGRGVAHLTLPRVDVIGASAAMETCPAWRPCARCSRPFAASSEAVDEIARPDRPRGQRRDHVRQRLPRRGRRSCARCPDRLKASC